MSHCDDNLKKIYAALLIWQEEHAGQNPPEILDLEGTAGLTAWDFICPASDAGIGSSPWGYRGHDLYSGAPAEMVLAFDKKPVHKGRRNVLFADGSMMRPPEKLFQSIIDKDNRLRQQLQLAEKPA